MERMRRSSQPISSRYPSSPYTTPESPWLRAGQNRATGMLISSTDSQTLR